MPATLRRRVLWLLLADVPAGRLGGRRPVAPAFGLPDLLLARHLAKTCRIHHSPIVGAIVVDIAVVCRTGFSVADKTGDSRKQEDPGDAGHVDSPRIDRWRSRPRASAARAAPTMETVMHRYEVV